MYTTLWGKSLVGKQLHCVQGRGQQIAACGRQLWINTTQETRGTRDVCPICQERAALRIFPTQWMAAGTR